MPDVLAGVCAQDSLDDLVAVALAVPVPGLLKLCDAASILKARRREFKRNEDPLVAMAMMVVLSREIDQQPAVLRCPNGQKVALCSLGGHAQHANQTDGKEGV